MDSFLLQTGHLWKEEIAFLIQTSQNMCPHVVVISSRPELLNTETWSMHTGHTIEVDMLVELWGEVEELGEWELETEEVEGWSTQANLDFWSREDWGRDDPKNCTSSSDSGTITISAVVVSSRLPAPALGGTESPELTGTVESAGMYIVLWVDFPRKVPMWTLTYQLWATASSAESKTCSNNKNRQHATLIIEQTCTPLVACICTLCWHCFENS